VSDSQTINNPSPTPNTQPKTYSIVPITVMSIGTMEPHIKIIAQKAYQEFLQTSNLNQLDESNQMEILVGIYARMHRAEIPVTQQNVDWIKQQLAATSTPIPFQPDSAIMTKLDELRQSLSNIQNQPVPMNVIEGRKQRAYQDWMQNNADVYGTVSGNTYYLNQISSIKQAYGI